MEDNFIHFITCSYLSTRVDFWVNDSNDKIDILLREFFLFFIFKEGFGLGNYLSKIHIPRNTGN
jgi:hypothetical protein